MLTKSKIALSLAVVIATGSAAMAAPKHAVRHHMAAAHSATTRQVPARAYLSLGSARAEGRVAKPSYMSIQDIGFKEYLGD
jgi:hypothetical protein